MSSFTRWRRNTRKRHPCHLQGHKAGSSRFLNHMKAAPTLLLLPLPLSLLRRTPSCSLIAIQGPHWFPVAWAHQSGEELCTAGLGQTSLALLWQSSSGWKYIAWALPGSCLLWFHWVPPATPAPGIYTFTPCGARRASDMTAGLGCNSLAALGRCGLLTQLTREG